MTPEIERLAKEAGFSEIDVMAVNGRATDKRFIKFAALVAESCAKECETLRFTEKGPTLAAWLQRNLCANAIRAKFALSSPEDAAK